MLLFLKNLLFTLMVPGSVAIYVPFLLVHDRPIGTGILRFASLILFVLGGSIYTWCVWDFAVFGRGTPAPIDAPKQLVVHGLYRFTRNPMYVGVITTILGWAILYQTPGLLLYALGVALCFQCFIVFYEEPYLQRTFGSSYQKYRVRVGRWLPRM